MNNNVRYPTGRTWLVLLVLTFSLLFITACLRDSSDNEDIEPKAKGLIPASIGNYWIYVDSTWWSSDSISVTIDTVEIIDTSMIDGEVWWHLSGFLPWVGARYMVRKDSVFTLQYNFGTDLVTLEYIPPSDTLVEYFVRTGGDLVGTRTVILHTEPISVLAGTFDSTGIYITNLGDRDYYETIIAPHIGIIKETAIKDTVIYHTGPPERATKTLKEYYLIPDY